MPTPTTPEGFDYSIVEGAIELIGKGNVAVIKSTMQPGSTEQIAKKYPDVFVMHSPEFLKEKTAAFDASNPDRNIIGITEDTEEYKEKAKMVMKVLAKAPYNKVMDVRSAELVKYIGNCFLMTKVVFFNVMYDIADKLDLNWEDVRDSVANDPRIGESHTKIKHESGHGGPAARGAGGHCFIKDFAAIRELHEKIVGDDKAGLEVLKSIEDKNINLLKSSGKDIDLLCSIYDEKTIGKS